MTNGNGNGKTAFELSIDQIADRAARKDFPGFAGVVCFGCGKTANVVVAPGWVCVCGLTNLIPASGRKLPFSKPDLGPSDETIHHGLIRGYDKGTGNET